jgi:hypothetical protein
MPVNPFEHLKGRKSSVIGIKETLRHLSDGNLWECFQQEKFLAIRRKAHGRKPWEEGAIKVIQHRYLLFPSIFMLK